MIQRDS